MASSKKGGTLRVFLVMAGITVITLFFVWTRLQNTRLRIENGRKKTKEQEALTENSRLKLEWAKQISPKRLEELGMEKYNLNRPRPDQVIVISEAK